MKRIVAITEVRGQVTANTMYSKQILSEDAKIWMRTTGNYVMLVTDGSRYTV